MYLSEIYLENTGPISKCHVEMPFADNSNPIPVVVVGPNGSGKSIFLSYIVDALMELAKIVYSDIVPSDGLRTPYYRTVHPMAIKSGASHSLSLLCFKTATKKLLYCEKSGRLDASTDYLSDIKSKFAPVWNWQPDGNHKQVIADEKIAKDEMKNGAHVFFPANRFQEPDWLNPESLTVGPGVTPIGQFNDQLDKPLRVENCDADNTRWILDVYLDSLVDLQQLVSNSNPQEYLIRQVLQQARQNLENILKTILQDSSAKLELSLRNIAPSRLAIRLGDGTVIPSLQSLSEGQSQLFNLLSTIIRYGDRAHPVLSINLSDFTGIVLIDEIDAHLHPSLQYEVVPQLIKLFPKVQFIMSSHSPLFVLGMEKEFGMNSLSILEFPTGRRINSQRYTEFGSAFKYYQDTEAFQQQVEQRFKDGTKPLVLTEGKLDACYIHTALDLLDRINLLDSIDVDSVGSEHEKGTRDGGKPGLNRFRQVYEANPSLFPRPILLLYDCDANKPVEHIDKLWVRSIPANPENTKVKKGIENLFPESLFEEHFYPENHKDDGGTYTELDKNAFCNWICEERKNPEDFAKFNSITQILEEFLEVHQSR